MLLLFTNLREMTNDLTANITELCVLLHAAITLPLTDAFISAPPRVNGGFHRRCESGFSRHASCEICAYHLNACLSCI